MWRCSVDTCTFNYTPETCADMHNNWTDSDFGNDHTDENHSHHIGHARNYFDKTALYKLQQKGTRELLYKKRARGNYFTNITMNSVNIFNTTTLVMAIFAIQTMIFGELL
jgi:hypothetical protein